ncbi:hypothetical protein FB645_005989, partial [Coemansia sp. IMI 203386]
MSSSSSTESSGSKIDTPRGYSKFGGSERGSSLQPAQYWQNSTANIAGSAAIMSPNGYIAFSDLPGTSGGECSAANQNNTRGNKQKARSASNSNSSKPTIESGNLQIYSQPRHTSLQPSASSTTDQNSNRRLGVLGYRQSHRSSAPSAPFLSPVASRACSISANAAISATVSSPAVSSLKVSNVTAAGAFSPPTDALALLTGSAGVSLAVENSPSSSASHGLLHRRFSRPLSYFSMAATNVVISAQASSGMQHSHACPIPDAGKRASSGAQSFIHHSLPSTARCTRLSPSLDRVQTGSVQQLGLSDRPASKSSSSNNDNQNKGKSNNSNRAGSEFRQQQHDNRHRPASAAIVHGKTGCASRGVDYLALPKKGIICSATPNLGTTENTRNQTQKQQQQCTVTAHADVFDEPARSLSSANNARRSTQCCSKHACANTTGFLSLHQQQTSGHRSFSLNTTAASRDAAAASQADNFLLSSDDHMCQTQGHVQSEACAAEKGSSLHCQISTSSSRCCCCAACINRPDNPLSARRVSLVVPHPSPSCSTFASSATSSSLSSDYSPTSSNNMVSDNGAVPHSTHTHNVVTVLPSDHRIMATMAKRNSVFYRRPRSMPKEQQEHPAIEEEEVVSVDNATGASEDGRLSSSSEQGYIPSDEDSSGSKSRRRSSTGQSVLECSNIDYSEYGNAELGDNSSGNGLTEEEQEEQALRLALCQELPYWSCYFTPDTHEFLYSHLPHDARRPATESAPPMVFLTSDSDFYPPTPEIVDSMVEYLVLMFHINTCSAVIPMERRLPDIREFIWRLLDGTMIDLWTAIACVILLRRYYRIQNQCIDAAYGAAHSLFLGIFMLASTQCVYTNNPELISLSSIVNILDSHYQVSDLVRIRREVFTTINHHTWISEEDIRSHAKNNIFDIYRVKSAYTFYKQRQEQRMMIKEEERRQETFTVVSG